LRGAIKGAGAGAVFGPVGAAVGGAVGLVAGYFSDDPEEQLRQRKEEFVGKINADRSKRIAETIQVSANNRQLNQQGAMVRAQDSGRDPSDIEDSLLVSNQQNTQDTNQALNSTNRYFDEQVLGAEGEFASRPLEEPLSDVLFEAGGNAIQGYYMDQQGQRQDKYIDAMTKNAQASATQGIPSVSTGITPTATPSASATPSAPATSLAVQPQGLMQSQNYAATPPTQNEYANAMKKIQPQGLMESTGSFSNLPQSNYRELENQRAWKRSWLKRQEMANYGNKSVRFK